MKTRCAHCDKILQDTNSKNVYAVSGKLFCRKNCAVSENFKELKNLGEYVDKESIGINKEVDR